MAEYVLVDSPAWDEVKASINGDGTSTFWANSFLPLWGRICAIAEFLVSGGEVPVGGVTLHGTSAGSGANLIGMPTTTIGGWSGGTLFDFLEAAFTAILNLDAAKLPLAGGTMTGAITFRAPTTLPDEAAHTMTLAYEWALIPDVSQLSLYTLPNPTTAGRWVAARRKEFGSGNVARVVRANGNLLASFPSSGVGSALFVSEDDGSGGFRWTCFWATGDAAWVA